MNGMGACLRFCPFVHTGQTIAFVLGTLHCIVLREAMSEILTRKASCL